MIGVVVAMHGDLAEAMVNTAKQVLKGFEGQVAAVGISTGDDASQFEARLRHALSLVQGAKGVLILTDMFGGTPSNVGLTLHRSGEVEILTGANLPMLIKAMQISRSTDSVELMVATRQVKEAGERAMAIATDVLTGGKNSAPRETLG